VPEHNPQLSVVAYLQPVPWAPISRIKKGLNAGGVVAATGVQQFVRAIPFWGRSRFSMASFTTLGGLTVVVNGYLFGSALRTQLSTQTLVGAGSTATFQFRDAFYDAIEILVTGTINDVFQINGYVADATLP